MNLKPYLLFVFAMAAPLAGAAENSRFSIEGSAGVSQFKFRRDQFRNEQGTTGDAPTVLSARAQDMSLRIGADYRVNADWGVDLNYQDTGKIRVRGLVPLSGGGFDPFTTRIHQTMWSLGISYRFPTSDPVAYILRFGFSDWENSYDHTGTPITGMHDESGTSPYVEFSVRLPIFRPGLSIGGNLGYQYGMQASRRLSGSLRYSF